MQLEELVNQKCNSFITGQEIDRLDETITYVLNAARRHIEGMKRTIKCTPRKIKLRSTVLYYSALKRKAEGKQIDDKALEGRRKFLELE